ncbi:MAG: arylsulfotransferase family protein, partial [Rhodovibrionaceae bacterium]
DRREAFTVYRPEALGEGRLLVAGLTPGRAALNSARLLDSAGEELHIWPFDYTRLDETKEAWNVFQHGIAVLEDGSIVVNFDSGQRLARFGACGDVLWSREGAYHHAVTAAEDGTLWTLEGEDIVQADLETGETLATISVVEDLIERHGRQGVFGLRTEENEADELEFSHDPLHGNHIEALPEKMAGAFPQFEAGDLLVSFRNLNLVAVLDPARKDLKWWSIGPWHRQHDPHFAPDGRILVYNNDMNFPPSQIVAIDPQTMDTEVLFEGGEETPFYSWRRGKFQQLPDGRLLIVESERGRVFMIDAEGELIFEYNNVFDETRNGVLGAAYFLPPDYFEEGALDCPAPQQSAEN